MLVGLKYCGGCNPKYDRGALARALVAALPEHEFRPARPGEEYDLLVVISGCHVQCADISALKFQRGPVYISSADGLGAAIEEIKKYASEGRSL